MALLQQLETTNDPTEASRNYFNREASLNFNYLFWGLLAQAGSFATEFFGAFMYLKEVLQFVVSPGTAKGLAFVLAGVVALLLELFIRSSIATHTEQVYNHKEQIADFADWFRFGFGVLLTICFIIVSGLVTKKGVEYTLERNSLDFETTSTAPIVDYYDSSDDDTWARYEADKSEIISRYENLKSDNTNLHYEKRQSLENDLKYWSKREEEGKGPYTWRKKTITDKIDDLHEAEAEQNVKYEKAKAEELAALKERRDERLASLEEKKENRVGMIETENEEKKNKNKEYSEWFAWFIRNLAMACVFVFPPIHINYTIWRIRAGLQTKVLVPKEFFESSLIAEASFALQLIATRPIRWGVRLVISKFKEIGDINKNLFYDSDDYEKFNREAKREHYVTGGGGYGGDAWNDYHGESVVGGGFNDAYEGSNGFGEEIPFEDVNGDSEGFNGEPEGPFNEEGVNGFNEEGVNTFNGEPEEGVNEEGVNAFNDGGVNGEKEEGVNEKPKRAVKRKKAVNAKDESLLPTDLELSVTELEEMIGTGEPKTGSSITGKATILHVDRQKGDEKELTLKDVRRSKRQYKKRYKDALKASLEISEEIDALKEKAGEDGVNEKVEKLQRKLDSKNTSVNTALNGLRLYSTYENILLQDEKSEASMKD